ncbi:hypothetical protein IWZ00DRAFT_94681 [Phyllosticta capitalensis]
MIALVIFAQLRPAQSRCYHESPSSRLYRCPGLMFVSQGKFSGNTAHLASSRVVAFEATTGSVPNKIGINPSPVMFSSSCRWWSQAPLLLPP